MTGQDARARPLLTPTHRRLLEALGDPGVSTLAALGAALGCHERTAETHVREIARRAGLAPGRGLLVQLVRVRQVLLAVDPSKEGA